MHVYRKTGLPGFQRKLLCAAISASLLPLTGAVLAQDDAPVVEEVIVTGSYIRRSEGFQSASPLTQLTLEDIAVQGTPNMGDIVHNLSFNQGSSISGNITPGSGSTETAINIRGLGAGATLNLMDGKRVVENNVNVMLPTIAIQRIDIVVDGAAALYGSAAVAGVVNFVPIKSYDGLKLEFYNQGDAEGDYQEHQLSAMWGGDLGGVELVIAGQWRENENLRWVDRPRQFYAGYNVSSSGNPGQFRVPQRDANGVLTGVSLTTPDAGCGSNDSREDPINVKSNVNGTVFNGRCRMDFGEWWEFNPKDQQGTFYANAAYEVSPDLAFNLQLTFATETYLGQNSASNPGGRVAELPTIRGELPGNPYRAVDANGNMLFALDANMDTLPDRDANGVVILDPNGIAFNEDVVFSGWRVFGKSQTTPEGTNSNGSFKQKARERNYRLAFDTNFTVPYVEGWDGTVGIMYSNERNMYRENNQSFAAISQGLNCDVLLDHDKCFNPFAVNANVLDPYTNPQNVADSIFPTEFLRAVINTDIFTADLIFNGTIPMGNFELPGGPIGMALGAQRRSNGFEFIPSSLQQAGDFYNGQQDFRDSKSRNVDAWFIEVSIPVLDNLEFSAATRDETYSTGQSSSDPKFGVVYSPFEWVTLRATKGTAFIAPGLNDLFAPERCNLANLDDPFSTFFAYARSCSAGNPDLTPETADTQSWGIEIQPIDNLRMSVEWSQTDFSDRIVSVAPQQLLAIDFFNFQQATGFGEGIPSLAQLAAWDATGADPRIERNPLDLGQILRITRGQTNASKMLVEAYDFKASYQFDLDAITGMFGWDNIGTIRLNLQATQIDVWDYQQYPTSAVTSPLGKRNRFVGEAPPLPEWKGNFSIGWVNGNHSASMITRYIDAVEYDGWNWLGNCDFQFFQCFDNSIRDELRASTIADVAYNYRGLEVMGSTVDLTIGSRNVFDRLPMRINDFAGMESVLWDARGRMIYGRVTMEF